MGLSELDSTNDKILGQKATDLATRKKLQTQVLKTNISEKPEGPNLWAVEKTAATGAGPTLKCHMQVTVVYLTASIPRGNTDGTDINDIGKEYFIPRKLAGEWSLEKLFYTNSNPDKPHKGRHMAAHPRTYGLHEYWRYVPLNIRNATPTFIQKYLQKYAGG